MTDPIDDLVEASIENGGRPTYAIGGCGNCSSGEFHGLPRGNCPGSHVTHVNPDDIHDAVLEWTIDWAGE